jgi:hypothetical protein
MNKTKKKMRKLKLSDFTRCHPSKKLGGPFKANNKCLPDKIYSDISKAVQAKHMKKNPTDVFKAVGCQPGEDHCLLDRAPLSNDLKKTLRKQYLRPRRPKAWDSDPDAWLDNYNIIHVMEQYQVAFPWFKFMGVYPIDFSAPDPYKKGLDQPKCLYEETCHINLKKEYYTNKRRGIGMVFNMDPHFKGGSHWVGLYINIHNIHKPVVSYFDSYGYETPALIARLMRTLKQQISSTELGFNARRFQYGGSECGMFSMYFLICMIHGISFKDFCKDSVNDAYMLELRKILFSK